MAGYNSHTHPHNPDFFRGLGFNRRQRVGMFIADLAAVATQNTPSNGGAWPSDTIIGRRLSQSDAHPAIGETPVEPGEFDNNAIS